LVEEDIDDVNDFPQKRASEHVGMAYRKRGLEADMYALSRD
jgi:hypothetical protein